MAADPVRQSSVHSLLLSPPVFPSVWMSLTYTQRYTHTHRYNVPGRSYTQSLHLFSFLLPCCLVTRSLCSSPWRVTTRAHTLVSVKEQSSTLLTHVHPSNPWSIIYISTVWSLITFFYTIIPCCEMLHVSSDRCAVLLLFVCVYVCVSMCVSFRGTLQSCS